MLKKLLLLGCFLGMITSSNAQLAAGDIAIIGVNYDAVPYEMTIVTLAAIPLNTVVRITDYGYDETTSTFGTTSVANTAEGSITWTTPSIAAGTVIKFTIATATTAPTPPIVTGLPGTVSVTGWTNTTSTTSPSPAGGDNWFIFQGSSATSVTTYIFAWANPFAATFNGVNQPAGQFIVPGTGLTPNNGNSYLPPSLTLGVNAIALNRNPADATEPGYHGDNNIYTGTFSGTKSAILAEICNISKWSHNEDAAYDITPGGTGFPGANPIFTLSGPNNAPTDITLSNTAVNENVAAASTVGTLSSTDPDTSNTFTYTLVAGLGSTDNSAFTITGNSLTINASPDFETKSSYSIRVRTTDQGSLFFDKIFTVNVNNVNEAPTDIALSATSISENVAAASTVGTLSSTDPDAGSSFTYSLVAGTGSTDNSAFTITGNTLTINASPDFETKNSYAIRVRTSDGALTFEKQFTISITNVNEAPTDIALSATTINENVAATATVGTLSSTDPDAGSSFTYILVAGTGSTDNSAFTITGNTLTINASPDFEIKNSYAIRVRTSDGALTFEKQFTISITNVNEAPTDIALSATAINENVAAAATVGTLSSTDPDTGSSFTYSLVAGTGSTDNAAFTITGNTLTINASPDFETKNSYAIRVRTSDGALTFEKQFTISITDLCDLNNSVTLAAGVLTATQTGASYQWRKCSDNSPVGSDSNTFTPTVSGDYKVDITIGSCTVTSSCTTVSSLGTTNFETTSKLSIYPNPSQGIINVESDSNGDYQVINQVGQVVKTFQIKGGVTNTINLQNLSNSIYFIKEINTIQKKSQKLIIRK